MSDTPETERYIQECDDEQECFKIIDTQTIVGTDDQDTVLIAHVFDADDATSIVRHLNANPTYPPTCEQA